MYSSSLDNAPSKVAVDSAITTGRESKVHPTFLNLMESDYLIARVRFLSSSLIFDQQSKNFDM